MIAGTPSETAVQEIKGTIFQGEVMMQEQIQELATDQPKEVTTTPTEQAEALTLQGATTLTEITMG
jgi:hypothetical protein